MAESSQADTTRILEASDDPIRGEVSASTVARMMGLATVGELKLLEGKIDLLGAKVNAMTVKLEKVAISIAGAPSGADLERIDVQIGALKTVIKDSFASLAGSMDSGGAKKASAKIVSNEAPPAADTAAAPK